MKKILDRILYMEILVFLALSLLMVLQYDAGAVDSGMKCKAALSKGCTEYIESYKKHSLEEYRLRVEILSSGNSIENAVITYYDCCMKCCGKTDGITASGALARPFFTVAVDPDLIPLGSNLLIDYGDGELHHYRAEDTGVHGDMVDVCVETHDEAIQLGICTATVYWIHE